MYIIVWGTYPILFLALFIIGAILYGFQVVSTIIIPIYWISLILTIACCIFISGCELLLYKESKCLILGIIFGIINFITRLYCSIEFLNGTKDFFLSEQGLFDIIFGLFGLFLLFGILFIPGTITMSIKSSWDEKIGVAAYIIGDILHLIVYYWIIILLLN